MVDITALDGSLLHVCDEAITMVTGGEPGDDAPRAYVTGPAPARIPVREGPARLVARLRTTKLLAPLTRLDGTPLWIAAGAVTLLRQPVAGESPPGAGARAMICLGPAYEAVRETVEQAHDIITRHGGRL